MSKYVALQGICSTKKLPIGIQFLKKDGDLIAVGCFISSSTDSSGNTERITGRVYSAGFSCRRCGNTCVLACECNTVFCVKSNERQVVCPKCNQTFNINWVEDVNELNESSINGNKQ